VRVSRQHQHALMNGRTSLAFGISPQVGAATVLVWWALYAGEVVRWPFAAPRRPDLPRGACGIAAAIVASGCAGRP